MTEPLIASSAFFPGQVCSWSPNTMYHCSHSMTLFRVALTVLPTSGSPKEPPSRQRYLPWWDLKAKRPLPSGSSLHVSQSCSSGPSAHTSPSGLACSHPPVWARRPTLTGRLSSSSLESTLATSASPPSSPSTNLIVHCSQACAGPQRLAWTSPVRVKPCSPSTLHARAGWPSLKGAPRQERITTMKTANHTLRRAGDGDGAAGSGGAWAVYPKRGDCT
mmetsp:Transcript_4738/g.13144  ORF Transcript_4738/g.13144 Transcript_4738/m.13144 type:complete len:219 (-) Transcript_4738:109-765(-)